MQYNLFETNLITNIPDINFDFDSRYSVIFFVWQMPVLFYV